MNCCNLLLYKAQFNSVEFNNSSAHVRFMYAAYNSFNYEYCMSMSIRQYEY